MNASSQHPIAEASPVQGGATRFPRLTTAEKALQAAAERAIMREVIAEMNLRPGISPGSGNPDRLSFRAWRR
jgi:hypothetical protein